MVSGEWWKDAVPHIHVCSLPQTSLCPGRHWCWAETPLSDTRYPLFFCLSVILLLDGSCYAWHILKEGEVNPFFWQQSIYVSYLEFCVGDLLIVPHLCIYSYMHIIIELCVFTLYFTYVCDFPGGSEGKASAYNVEDLGSIPGSGRSPEEGNGGPHQCSCLENPMDRGAWWAIVYGVAKSWTRLSDFTSFSFM